MGEDGDYMPEGSYKDKVLLEKLYNEQEMTQKEIAEYLGCSQTTVSKYMGKYGIKTRDPVENLKNIKKENKLKKLIVDFIKILKRNNPGSRLLNKILDFLN